MATTITIPTPNIHWLLYPLLVCGLVFGLYLWHDTEVKDTAAIQAVSVAKTTQATVDKQVTVADTTAEDTLAKQNAALTAQLAAAKSQAAQIALINKEDNTHIVAQPQATNPSSPPAPVMLPSEDLPVLAKQAVDFQEAENQVAADKVELAGCNEKVSAADDTISADNKEITALKGGSRWKRFLHDAKNVGIGVGIGVVTEYALSKK